MARNKLEIAPTMKEKNRFSFKGDILRKARLAKGFQTPMDFAVAIYSKFGIMLSEQLLSLHEKGNHMPKLSTAFMYSSVLGVKPEDLLTLKN